MIVAQNILAALTGTGYTVIPVASECESKVLLGGFGKIALETEVRLRKRAKTYLSSFEPVPLHTDHPVVKYVAWYCAMQDTDDGTSILVDLHRICSALTEKERAELSRVLMRRPELYSIEATSDLSSLPQRHRLSLLGAVASSKNNES